MDKKDLSKLSGEELFYYFTKEHDDEDYSSIVELLPYATMDYGNACSILERVVRENKSLIAFYPEFDDIDTSNMEHVGDIMDGDLYISNDHYFKD